MPRRNVDAHTTAVFDIETDPFAFARPPYMPFTCGFLASDGVRLTTWGDDCVREIMQQIADLDRPYLIFAHNGGRFDFKFLWEFMEESIFAIDKVPVEFTTRLNRWKSKRHIWRDSYRIIRVAMEDYRKEEIDYRMFVAERRSLPVNRKRIEAYLTSDLEAQLELLTTFRERFGKPTMPHLPLTAGQLAMREVLYRHPIRRASDYTDQVMRPFYFGGRMQNFAAGVIDAGEGQKFKLYDINSAYAAAMRDFDHPLSDNWIALEKPPLKARTVWFARIRAKNRGALPWHDQSGVGGDGGWQGNLRFDISEGEFVTCSHELLPAMRRGQVDVLEWLEISHPATHGRFRKFVNDWHRERVTAIERGDKAGAIFANDILRTASGKFGQNPREYKQYKIADHGGVKIEALEKQGYATCETIPTPQRLLDLMQRPAPVVRESFVNVGISASITSAGRAMLMDGLERAIEPVYCDTDSIVARHLDMPLHPLDLGRWKLQATGRYVAIAAKQVWCLFDVVQGRVRASHRVPGSLTAEAIIKRARESAARADLLPDFDARTRDAETQDNSNKTSKTVASEQETYRV